MKYFVIAALAFSALFSMPSYAADQTPQTPEEQQIARDKMKADKKFVVSDNLKLTESESKVFWPLYEAYQADQAKLNDRVIAVIQDYAKNYKTMTDAKAMEIITQKIDLDIERVNLAKSYLPKFSAVLPGVKVARYFQVESRINLLINLDIAKQVPMVVSTGDTP
jgi:hypothetical protein